MAVALNVQVVSGGTVLAQHQFDSDSHRTIKIGRLPSAQLKLDDPKASRIHAVIEFSGADVSLIDMGSTVGTSVNGAKVHKVKLGHGDQIAIGDTQLIVGLGAPAAAAVAPAAAPAGQPGVAPAPAAAPGGSPWPQAAAPAAGMPQQPVAAAPMPGQAPAQAPDAGMPRFDPGSQASAPLRRITKERLRSAAVESRPHPALPPEQQMQRENRVLEMRMYWGEILLGVHHYDKPKKITIGETKKTDVFISSEGLPIEAFPLIRYIGEDYVLTFCNAMEGEVEINKQLHPLQEIRASGQSRKDDELEGSYQVALPPEMRALIHWGGATFAMRFVAPPKMIPTSFLKNLDLQYINMLLLSIFFHIALVVTFLVYPYDTESLREDLFNEPDRFASLILEPPKETTSTKSLLDKLKKTVERKKEEKKPPAEKKPKLVSKQVVEKTKRPKKTREQKSAEVKEKFTRLFSGTGSGSGGSMLGGGGGGTLAGTLSNVIGTTGAGSATASLAGLGIRGGALTGGGIGTSRGIAGIGTAGRLGGGGMAYGSGVGIGKRKDRNLLSFSTPVVMGALPKEVIQKVINQNKNQIRYCYEVELQRNQKLSGKVGMKWVIAATGSVARVIVTESTIKNRNVENCIKAKIKTWKFPAPAGGGIVEVNYPFVFKATG